VEYRDRKKDLTYVIKDIRINKDFTPDWVHVRLRSGPGQGNQVDFDEMRCPVLQ